MNHFRVVDSMMQCLVVQEVKHVLYGERECAAAVRRAEDRLEQIVHVLLEGTLPNKTMVLLNINLYKIRVRTLSE